MDSNVPAPVQDETKKQNVDLTCTVVELNDGRMIVNTTVGAITDRTYFDRLSLLMDCPPDEMSSDGVFKTPRPPLTPFAGGIRESAEREKKLTLD